jgi:hypothetical protein
MLSINTMGFDVSSFFQYFPGSHTRAFSTTLYRTQRRRVNSDPCGMGRQGNGSLDTLSLTVSAASGLL